MIVYLSSQDSKHLYPSNMPTSFVSHLAEPIAQKGQYMVALLEVNIPPLSTKYSQDKLLTIYCSICEHSLASDTKLPILRKVCVKAGTQTNILLDPVIYIPVRLGNIQDIQMYIKQDDHTCPSLDEGDFSCTLHFKQI